MKKIHLLLFSSVLIFLFSFSANAADISVFNSEINMQEDGSLQVTETLVYDFGQDQKNGIYRDIPTDYSGGKQNYSITLDDFAVFDENSSPLEFEISNVDGYKHIEIGDKNQKISGRKTYVIKYSARNAVKFGDTVDSFFWNITGDEWPVVIKEVKAVLNFPRPVSTEALDNKCWYGSEDSFVPCLSDRLTFIGKNTASQAVYLNENVQIGKGVVISVSLPKAALQEPTLIKRLWLNIGWIRLFVAVIVLLVVYLSVRFKNRIKNFINK